MTYLGVKFRAVLMGKNFPRDIGLDELKSWCTEFYNHGFTPEYEGGSAGNLSYRIKEGENQFIITGAGIVSKAKILDNSLVQVKNCDIEKEIAYYYGTRKPSSESLVHCAIYNNRKDVSAVFHGHSEKVLSCTDKLGIVQTKQQEPEGTGKLAKAVLEVLGNENFIVMKDHGFISLGRTMKEAGDLAIKMQQKCI
jgi:ribulose-5-phosphate 4-epimerase/fuculose-1-phosphate aldolase